jgi:hypothetical protein
MDGELSRQLWVEICHKERARLTGRKLVPNEAHRLGSPQLQLAQDTVHLLILGCSARPYMQLSRRTVAQPVARGMALRGNRRQLSIAEVSQLRSIWKIRSCQQSCDDQHLRSSMGLILSASLMSAMGGKLTLDRLPLQAGTSLAEPVIDSCAAYRGTLR